MSSLIDSELTFNELGDKVGLHVALRKAVASLTHVHPTLVQSKCLPLAISEGRDLLVRARTGSGKTLAYCLPLMHKILQSQQQIDDATTPDPSSYVHAVILVPTRELCNQVEKTIGELSYYCNNLIRVATLPGMFGSGGNYDNNNDQRKERKKQELARQEAKLRDRPNIIIATPAGLLAHIRSGSLDLKTSVETLVVDEADLVLSFGYGNDIAEIMKSLPKICQGFLMSATLSPGLNSLKKVVLHSPAILKLEEDDAGKQIAKDGKLTQFYLRLPRKDNYLVLYVFLKLGLLRGKGIFFVNSTDAGYRLKLFLEQFHIRSAVLNAELPFRSRVNIQEQFNVGNFDYLIATDESTDVGGPTDDGEQDDVVDSEEASSHKKRKGAKKKGRRKDSEYGVSRGLDFRNVSFVVNVDFPPSPQSYTHRVGRTARGGAKGVALSLVDADSAEHDDLLSLVQQEQAPIPIARSNNHLMQTAAPSHNENDNGSPISDNRPQSDYQVQPQPLDFDLKEIEGFRYRVEDVSRAVTKTAVRETRAAELRAEILNSDRLQSHFDENPADLQILRHDRLATHVSKVQEHLKHIPKYMLPRGMQVADLNKKRKRKRIRNRSGTAMGQRRTDNDPLQSYDGDINLDGVADGGDASKGDQDEYADFFNDDNGNSDPPNKKKKDANENKIFANTSDGTGLSTSGRKQWKEKHKRGGKHNKKSQRKYDTRKSQKGF